MGDCKQTIDGLLCRGETRKNIYPNSGSGAHYPRGSKSPQSLLPCLFVVLPHVGCGGFEGAKTPIPALKNGGGVGCVGCGGGLEKGVTVLLRGREIL